MRTGGSTNAPYKSLLLLINLFVNAANYFFYTSPAARSTLKVAESHRLKIKPRLWLHPDCRSLGKLSWERKTTAQGLPQIMMGNAR